MSQSFEEGRLRFKFPEACRVCRPGNSSYYKRHFANLCGGCKEVDFLVLDPVQNQLRMIEVKDYEAERRAKQLDLVDEICLKARDSLALLLPAKTMDNAVGSTTLNVQVGTFAREALSAREIRLVLHCELPKVPSKLFPGIKDSANLQMKLRLKARSIDPHALCMSTLHMRDAPWRVEKVRE
jgi:hypothetical protein